MKAHFVLFCAVFVSWCYCAQYENTTLPYLSEDGSWELVRNKQHIELPKTMFEVSTFDASGKAFFYATNGSGLLDTNGTILYQSTSTQVVQLSNGAYLFKEKEKNHIFRLDKQVDLYCSDFHVITKDWFFYKQDTTWYFSNTNWKEGIPFKCDYETIAHADDELLILDINDSIRNMYASSGNLIYTGDIRVTDYGFGVYIQCEKRHLLRDQYGTIEFPLKSTSVTITPYNINYTVGSISYWLDRKTRKILFSFPCSEIELLGEYYKCYRNNRCIVTTKSGSIRLQAAYADVWKSVDLKGCYIGSLNGVTCLLDSNFNEITPCKYITFRTDGDFILARTEMQTYAVYSKLTFKELLPPIYRTIRILNNHILKGWENNRLTYLELSDKHDILTKFVVDNVVSINQTKEGEFEFDRRLLGQGWFFDADTIRNQYGRLDAKHVKWGLQKNDSILYGPKKYTPLYIPGADFNLLESERAKFNFQTSKIPTGVTRLTDLKFYSVINHQTGLMNGNRKIIYIDTVSFETRSYYRYFGTDGAGILFRDGSAQPYAFVDVSETPIVRVCQASAVIACDTYNPEGIPLSAFISSQNWSYGEKYELLDGKWNYIDATGKPIFKTDFDYIEPFHYGTAIYREGSMYGVVSLDSVLVPAIYSKIERLATHKDTLFLVQRTKNKTQFFTAIHQKLPSEVSSARKILHYSVVPKKGGYALWDADCKEVLDGFNSVKLTAFQDLLFRSKKEYILRDTSLQERGRFTTKPIEFITKDQFIFGDNRLGICSINGDTLLAPVYHTISVQGNFITAITPSATTVFSTTLEELKVLHSGQIFIDSMRNQFLIWNDNTLTTFTEEGKKYHSTKLTSTPLLVHNGFAFLKNGQILSVEKDASQISLPSTYRHVEILPGGYLSIQNKNGKWSLFTRTGESVTAIQEVSHIEAIDTHVFCFTRIQKEYLVDLLQPKHLVTIQKVIGTFQCGLLLIKDSSGYHYLNKNLIDEFSIAFEDAEPFGERFACVKIRAGWTIMNRKGWMTCIAENTRIAQRGQSIFETQAQPVYGLIDSHGNTILDIRYERITFLTKDLIQVREGNKLHYFTLQGAKLLE